MDYFGINSPNDLPKIKEVLADEAMNATIIKPEDFASSTTSAEDSENSTIIVNEQGELLINDEGNTNKENSENNEEDSNKNSEE
jgi:segregation and condensation protein B